LENNGDHWRDRLDGHCKARSRRVFAIAIQRIRTGRTVCWGGPTPHHAATHPSQCPRTGARADHVWHRIGDSDRKRTFLSRLWIASTFGQLGRTAQRRSKQPFDVVARGLSGHSDFSHRAGLQPDRRRAPRSHGPEASGIQKMNGLFCTPLPLFLS